MGALNKRGVWVPATGDGLLEAWQTMAAQIGAFVPVASVAEASAVLTQAESAGIGASTSAPILFLVGSGPAKVAYTADGSKANGLWSIEALGKPQIAADTYATAWTGYKDFQVSAGGYSGMMTTSLPAAPYDRIVTAQAMAYGQRVSGAPRLRLKMHDGKASYGTFDADGATATAGPLSCVIPANAAPSIAAGLWGGGGSLSQVKLSGAEDQNGLMVTAWPASMAV